MTRPLLIVDLEATCWAKREHIPEQMETIEIGALLVDPDAPAVPREFQTFVRPVRHPGLSAFCCELTTIQQSDVDCAEPFSQSFARFLAWIGDPGAVRFASWGEYDKHQFQRDCAYHALPYPFAADHLNLKRSLGERLGIGPTGMARALVRAGLELRGTHHRALDDARNLWRLWQHLEAQGGVDRLRPGAPPLTH